MRHTPSPATAAARETSRQRTGQFGEQHHADSGIVTIGAEPRTVQLADGTPVTITPGVLDDNARQLYTAGQCLALAVQLAKQSNAAGIPAGVTILSYSLDVDYDDEQDGDEERAIQHCWATIGDRWYDVDGETNRDTIQELLESGGFSDACDDDYTAFYEYGPDELDLCLADATPWIGAQDHDLADGFATIVWDQHQA